MANEKCSVCGKKANTLTSYATEIGNSVICHSCYSKITKLQKGKTYNNKEELTQDWDEVMAELNQLEYPESVVQDINQYFANRCMRYTETKFNQDVSSGKYNQLIEEHLMTSGFDFQGYRIIRYLDVVTGESVLGTGMFSSFEASSADFLGIESSAYAAKLQEARNYAKQRAILKSIALGGNALIGVDFDYVNFTTNMIGVIVNGTSVIIEKIDE